MEWIGLTEIIAGWALDGGVDPHSIDPNILHEPYDTVIIKLRQGAKEHELFDVVSTVRLTDARLAAKNAGNGSVHKDEIIKACSISAARNRAGVVLDPIVKRWVSGSGKEGDIDKAVHAIGNLEAGKSFITPLGEADVMESVWRPTFYKPVDTYFQGVPEASLTVIGGPPGTGKTSFLGRLLINAAKQGKKVGFFSLEMTVDQIAKRFMELDKTGLRSKKIRNNILVADGALSRNEIYAEAGRLAAKHDDLYLIGIDFADMIIPDRWSKGGVEQIDEIYRTMAALAKQINVPVIVLSQLNASYIGGRPKVNHLRGSRLIEALAAMVILLYNPEQIDIQQEDPLLDNIPPGYGCFILGKSRYGFKEGATGAVPVEWLGAKGWGEKHGGYIKLFGV
jgi:hypothetical protein